MKINITCIISMAALFLSGTISAERQLKFTAATPVSQDSELVKIISEVYRRANISVTVTPMPAKRADYENFASVSDGELLRVASFGHNKPYLIQLSIPVGYIEIQRFSAKKPDLIDMENLCTNEIVIVAGGKFAGDMVEKCRQVVTMKSARQLIMYLNHKRADIGILDKTLGLAAINQLQNSQVVPVGPPIKTVPVYHFLNTNHKALVPVIEDILIEMTESGELEAMWQKYIEKTLVN